MVIPADHLATAEAIGLTGIAQLMLKAGFNYRHTVAYLLHGRKFKSLSNFLYTKTLVPTGEGSGELAYYFIGGLIQRYPQLAPYPRNIEIEITSRCNKRCIICEHTWWDEPISDLSFSDLKKVVDQLPLRWINLTGEGDAFLNKDYLSMIAYLKQRGISVYLVDSMDLVTPDISLELVKLGIDGIYISIDGATAQTYEDIKVGCNFNRTLLNLRGLLEAKRKLKSPLPEICFRYVVTKTNVHEMAQFMRLVRVLDNRHGYGDGSKIHFVGLLDYPEVHDLYLDVLPQQYVQDITDLSKRDGYLPAVFAHTGHLPSINRCLAWMEPYLALVPRPMVLPCCAVLMSNSREKLLKYCFGDYTKELFKDIWNSPYYKWFRQTVTKRDAPVPAICVGCRAYDTTERAEKYGIDNRAKEDPNERVKTCSKVLL